MGKLISVIGNCGSGKTTFTCLLAEKMNLKTGLEEHSGRPFQEIFKRDPNFAFPNQVDYMMVRFGQEYLIRSGDQNGITDGGMELDFHVFSRLFLQKGWLKDSQFSTLEQFYRNLRKLLPPPDLYIYLQSKPETIIERFHLRGRPLEIATINDLETINSLLEEWLTFLPRLKLLSIVTSDNDLLYQSKIPRLLEKLSKLNYGMANE